MASLTGTKIKDTYDGLLKTIDNAGIGATAKQLTDGLGTGSPLYVSTSKLGVGVSPSVKLHIRETGAACGLFLDSDETTDQQNRIASLRSSGGAYSSLLIDANTHIFRTGTTEKMRIDSSGNLLMNNSSSTIGLNSTDGSDNKRLLIAGANTASHSRGAYMWLSGNEYGVGGTISMVAGEAGYLSFTTGSTPTERMRIDSSGDATFYGNVLLSKSAPFITLSNTSEDECGILMRDSADVSQSAKITYDAGASNALKFYNNAASERMRITSGGDILFGTQGQPDGTTYFGSGFHPSSFDRDILQMAANGTGALNLIEFFNPNGNVGKIQTSGSATVYATSSDYRLKEDWQPMSGALDRVDALKPVNFAWKADGSRVDGFLAHELAEVVPEAVTGEKDAMKTQEYEVSPAVYEEVVHPAEEAVYETIEHPAIAEELDEEGNVIVEAQDAWNEEVLVSEAKEEWTEKVLVSEAVMGTREVPDYQGIDQSKIVPLLVAAIQELKAEIEALKAI